MFLHIPFHIMIYTLFIIVIVVYVFLCLELVIGIR